jgi:hypothetical protein
MPRRKVPKDQPLKTERDRFRIIGWKVRECPPEPPKKIGAVDDESG